MVRAAVLYTDGTMELKEFNESTEYADAIGGWLAGVKLFTAMGEDAPVYIYVDDEGLLKKLPHNTVASGLSFMLGNTPHLVGTAIVVGGADEDGNDTDIPEWVLSFLTEVCGKREN